jgi:hypothetical protein
VNLGVTGAVNAPSVNEPKTTVSTDRGVDSEC